MNISKLKFPPLKYNQVKELPDKLIYGKARDIYGQYAEEFVMFSTKKGSNNRAIMRCYPELIERDGKINVPSLYIWFLSSNCSGQGYGTAMLNFAIKHSKQIGCNGNFHLTADTSFMPNRIPHIFYRKFGMNTTTPAINKKLDKFIAHKKNATHRDFEIANMYYPPLQNKNKFLEFIQKKFLWCKYLLNGGK